MMKYLLAASALLATTPAFAQDAPAAPAGGGFYVGAHVGYNWTKPDYQDPGSSDYDQNPTVDGFAGGIIAGYDFPVGALNLGIEGDIGLLGGDEDEDSNATFNDYTAFENKWNAHLRLKAGVPVGSVNLFAAAGLALARIEVDDTDQDYGSFAHTYTGWTLGGGAEFQLQPNLKVRAEYLHDEFGEEDGGIDYQGSNPYDIEVNPSSNLIRFAVLFAL